MFLNWFWSFTYSYWYHNILLLYYFLPVIILLSFTINNLIFTIITVFYMITISDTFLIYLFNLFSSFELKFIFCHSFLLSIFSLFIFSLQKLKSPECIFRFPVSAIFNIKCKLRYFTTILSTPARIQPKYINVEWFWCLLGHQASSSIRTIAALYWWVANTTKSIYGSGRPE